MRAGREAVWQRDYRPVPAPQTIDVTALIEVERPKPQGNPFRDADAEPMAKAIEQEVSAMFSAAVTTPTGDERVIVRVTGLEWRSGGGLSQVIEPTVTVLDVKDRREIFRATRQSKDGMRAYYLDVAEVFGLLKADLADAFDRAELAAFLPERSEQSEGGGARSGARSVITDAEGFYAIERDGAFNVLEAVEFRPATREVVLIGRYDGRFGARRIPYLQHLAALLDHPEPEFSLDWTPDSERRVDAFLARMDSIDEMRELTAVSGQWLGRDGLPTAQGRVMLPLFGVKPTRNGRAAGQFGATTSLTADQEGLRIDRIVPGSAAARAGLRVGDIIHFFAGRDVLYPSELVREAALAGAGAVVKVTGARASGELFNVDAALDASREDPWRHVTRYDIAAQMLRQIGLEKGAQVLEALDVARRLVNTPVAPKTVFVLFGATEAWNVYEEVMAAQARREMTLPEAQRRMHRAVVSGVEDGFRLAPGTLTGYFDAAMRRGLSSSPAFSEAMLHLDEKIEPLLKDMLRTLLRRNDEIVLPVNEIERRFGGRPEVTLRFTGGAPDSTLARLMYEADYLGKSLLHRPDLKQRIARYRTEYEFEADRAGSSPATVTRRMWISVDALAATEGASGQRLLVGEPRMRFNVRDIRAGRDLPPQPGGYETLLTSLYEPFAEEFPVLHELREAAKLAAVAQWMRRRAPEFRLPREGRSRWATPSRVPGLVYLIWSPRRTKVAMVAAGGISLKVPPIGPSGPLVPLLPYPAAGGTPVLLGDRDIGTLAVRPQPLENRTLARVLGGGIRDVPVPRPNGWVATADKGRRTALALAVPAVASCQPARAAALDRELAQARQIARQLNAVENAINAITRKNPDRQATLDTIDADLRRARDDFVREAINVITQGMFDTFDGLDKQVAGTQLDELYKGAGAMREARDGLKGIEEKLGRIRLAYDAIRADDIESREKAIDELTDLATDLLADGKIVGNTPTRRTMQQALRTLNRAQALKDLVDTAEQVHALARAATALRAITADTDRDLARLRDTLLPAQRRLSDRLDDAMKTPAVKEWLGGDRSALCG